MAERPRRSQVPVEETWNLHDIYPSDEAWEADLARVPEAAAAVRAYQGHLHEGGATLLACLRARDAFLELAAKVGAYARLHQSADGTDPNNQSMSERAGSALARAEAEVAFLTPELLALPEGTIERYLREEPGLSTYRRQLERVARRRPHTLGAEAEEAIASLGEALAAPSAIYQRATSADLDFPSVRDARGEEVAVSLAGAQRLLASTDRDLRRRVHEALGAGLRRHHHTLATALASVVKRNVTMARLRRFASAEQMILHGQEVPYEVYTNVLDVIHDEIAPHVRRLMRLRKRVLGLDELRSYDLAVPLDPGFDPQYTWEDAERLIREGLAPLGEEYGEILRRAFHERWVDRADNVGKPHGAFCSSVYGVHPYILMTWTGRLRNVFTLAHELGHAAHGMLAARNQVVSNVWTTLFFVEAPSTCNEVFLGTHLLATARDPRLRRHVIQQFMGTFLHNMVTHLLQGHLERRLYRLAEAGRPLTLATITEAQAEVYERFYQGTVVFDEVDHLDWMTVPHYYRGLYPYTYAAGLTCGVAVARAAQREGRPAVERWLEALKAGGTLPPLELMTTAGVDMTTPAPMREAVAFFGELVAELEKSF
ncbi:MAG: oligoendopeptidase F [Clostridia bacterium]|nr:oligoendopeptidase F [Clostridia bacterium]